jgi:hypothetical protein
MGADSAALLNGKFETLPVFSSKKTRRRVRRGGLNEKEKPIRR